MANQNNFFLNAYKKNNDLLKNSQLEVDKLEAMMARGGRTGNDVQPQSDPLAGKTVKPFVFEKIATSMPIPAVEADITEKEVSKGKISKVRLSAIFLIISGLERAVQTMRAFSQYEQEKLLKELFKVESISEFEVVAVEEVFGKLDANKNLSIYPNGKEFARLLLQQLEGIAQGSTTFVKIAQENVQDEYEYLNKLSAGQLKDLLEEESDFVLSTVLTLLSPEKSAAVIAKLPSATAVNILKMIRSKSAINSDVIKTVISKLNGKAKEIHAGESIRVQGKQRLVEILRASTQEDAQNIIDAISEENPDLAQEIEQSVFTFYDVIKLQKAELELALKEYDNNEIAFMLKGVKPEVKAVFFTCLSKRRAEIVRAEIEILGAVKKSEVALRQRDFIEHLKELDSQGKIRLDGDKEIYVE